MHVTGRDRILKIEKRLFFESAYGVGIHIMHFWVPIICCINLIVNYASLSTGAVGYIYISSATLCSSSPCWPKAIDAVQVPFFVGHHHAWDRCTYDTHPVDTHLSLFL